FGCHRNYGAHIILVAHVRSGFAFRSLSFWERNPVGQINNNRAGSSRGRTSNMSPGSSEAHTRKREANAVPSTAPPRKAVHTLANRAARHQGMSHESCASGTGARLIPTVKCWARSFKSPVTKPKLT